MFQSIDTSKLTGIAVLNSGEASCSLNISGNSGSCNLPLSSNKDNFIKITWSYFVSSAVSDLTLATAVKTIPAASAEIKIRESDYTTAQYDYDADKYSNLQELSLKTDPLVAANTPVAYAPDLIGLSEADASTLLTALGFTLGVKSSAYHDSISANYIIAQSPASNVNVAAGSAIDIVVSLGVSGGVPNVVGSTIEAARSTIAAAGFIVGSETMQFSDIVPKDNVISQTPSAGTALASGSSVDLVISLGPSAVVPNLLGVAYNDAVTAITSAKLVVGTISSDYSSTVPKDYIISQSPSLGNTVAVGSAVNIVVSLGPSTNVPNLVGLTVAQATTAIASANLTLGTQTTAFSDTVPKDQIISQNPVAGYKTAVGTSVDIEVSLGKSVAVPNVVGLTLTQSRTAITSANLIVGTETAAYSSTVPKDQIISQNPIAGQIVAIGSAINTEYSLGVDLPKVLSVTPVDLSIIRNNQALKLQFDRTMDTTSANVSGALVAPGYTAIWSTSSLLNDTLDIKPGTTWNYADAQSVTINAADATGLLFSNYVLSFDVRKELVAFITSATGTGDLSTWTDAGGLTGIKAADQICNTVATRLSYTGSFMAWLSDGVEDAYCRMHGLTGQIKTNCGQTSLPNGAGPWIGMDGRPYLGRLNSATDYATYNPIVADDAGLAISLTNTLYFIGEYSLRGSAGSNCTDWTSAVSTQYGFTQHMATSNGLLHNSNQITPCSGTGNRLLCMEKGAGPVSGNFDFSAKKVFKTADTGTGNLSAWPGANGNTGLAAGDAICQDRAAAAGFVNASRFKAWLSSTTVNAIDRLTSAGPWGRADGVIVATSKADLTDGTVGASILDQNGKVQTNYVFTGTLRSGLVGTGTCGDWTVGDATQTAESGVDTLIYPWTEYLLPDCSAPHALICFED